MSGTPGPDGHLDEGTVHAWLDGQIPPADATRIEAHVASCAPCAALVAEARGYVAASTRILTALDGVPARVVPQARRPRRLWQARIAAAIVVMTLGTAVIVHLTPGGLDGVRTTSTPRAALRAEQSGTRTDNLAHNIAPAPVAAGPTPSIAGTPTPAPAFPAPRVPLRQRALAASPRLPTASTHGGAAPEATQGAAGGAVTSHPSQAPEALAEKSAARDFAAPRAAAPRAKVETSQAKVGNAPAPSPTSADSLGRPVPQPTIENALQGKVADAMPVRGRVVDAAEGEPIREADVIVSGTTIGNNTTDSGTFHLGVPQDAKSLTVRRSGYLAQTVPLTPGATDYTIPMKKDVLQLESQVVTGAAVSAQSQNSANSVATLASPESAPAASARAALAGPRSACRDRVVRVATTASADTGSDSATVRLSRALSTDVQHPGFTVQLLSDSAPVEAGTWQPLGRDSAIVSINGLTGVVQSRVRCALAGARK